MFMGVPYIPFFIGAGGVLLLAMYTNLLFLFLMPLVIFILRQLTRRDEMIFRLIGLRLQVRLRMRNLGDYKGMWVLSQNEYRQKPPVE